MTREVRLGEVIDQDMIAVAVSGKQRQGAFAALSYIELFGKPEHPSELSAHRCIGWRPARLSPSRRQRYVISSALTKVTVVPDFPDRRIQGRLRFARVFTALRYVSNSSATVQRCDIAGAFIEIRALWKTRRSYLAALAASSILRRESATLSQIAETRK